MSNEKRKLTWTICVNDAREGERPRWRNIGAAWETQSGNLFVKVDEGESLERTAMMFPYREKSAGAYRRPERPRPPYPPQHPPADYMERKRAERARQAPVKAAPLPPPPPPTDECPDPEAPEWL